MTNTIRGKLDYSLYLKPTNTFSYLMTCSNHPDLIFKNIPKSVFFRTRRICTYLFDYYFYSRMFYLQFLKRGYSSELLNKSCRMEASLGRNKIIPYKTKTKKFSIENKIFFKIPYNFNYLNLESFFINFNLISNHLLNHKIKLINSIKPSISRIFVHNYKLKKSVSFRFSKCSKKSCKHCCFADSNSFIKLNNFTLPIQRNTSCEAKNLIYILYCNLCLL
jgi:hypothetical protein